MVEDRKPKFAFEPTLRRYGQLDISSELIVCTVHGGRLIPNSYPKSWEDGVMMVGTAEARKKSVDYATATNADYEQRLTDYRERMVAHEAALAMWKDNHEGPRPKPPQYPSKITVSPVTLLVALNEARDCYEIVYDPHDLGGLVDPMMLLNFRRKV